jgi:hypothetical protein
VLEQHAKATSYGTLGNRIASIEIDAKKPDAAGSWPQQAEHFAQQGRFAAAGTAQQTNDLPSLDAQVQIAMHVVSTKYSADADQLDNRRRAHNWGKPM